MVSFFLICNTDKLPKATQGTYNTNISDYFIFRMISPTNR